MSVSYSKQYLCDVVHECKCSTLITFYRCWIIWECNILSAPTLLNRIQPSIPCTVFYTVYSLLCRVQPFVPCTTFYVVYSRLCPVQCPLSCAAVCALYNVLCRVQSFVPCTASFFRLPQVRRKWLGNRERDARCRRLVHPPGIYIAAGLPIKIIILKINMGIPWARISAPGTHPNKGVDPWSTPNSRTGLRQSKLRCWFQAYIQNKELTRTYIENNELAPGISKFLHFKVKRDHLTACFT